MCIPRFRSTEVFFINNVPPARGVPGIFIQKLAFLESTDGQGIFMQRKIFIMKNQILMRVKR
ncbi:Uncharacterised protein [Klebsiella variicola]|nr:Uncharacterised protein [Klebsiella variicola]